MTTERGPFTQVLYWQSGLPGLDRHFRMLGSTNRQVRGSVVTFGILLLVQRAEDTGAAAPPGWGPCLKSRCALFWRTKSEIYARGASRPSFTTPTPDK
jgi:hypothetical protein